MSEARPKQFVAVFDFGAQYGQLIARRVRDLHVYSEIVPCDISADELAAMAPSAIILSGGPNSTYEATQWRAPEIIFQLGVPILGICYGMQLISHKLGGKVEPGESPIQALRREIREELDTEISVDKFLTTIEWDYPKFHLTMHCYMCSLLNDALHLNEHEAARWLRADELRSVNWLPADDQLLPLITQELHQATL